jgi:thiamine kinase-like enzyme
MHLVVIPGRLDLIFKQRGKDLLSIHANDVQSRDMLITSFASCCFADSRSEAREMMIEISEANGRTSCYWENSQCLTQEPGIPSALSERPFSACRYQTLR